eukprot:2643753-Prymnesium_polylepis.1
MYGNTTPAQCCAHAHGILQGNLKCREQKQKMRRPSKSRNRQPSQVLSQVFLVIHVKRLLDALDLLLHPCNLTLQLIHFAYHGTWFIRWDRSE